MPGLVQMLPAVNALLNAASAVCLATGYGFARQRRRSAHMACMLSAVGLSVLFLIGYLTRHALTGMTRFAGEGWLRPAYFALLVSHTLLAAATVPLVLVTLSRGLRGRTADHVRLARVTFPIWLYVSMTGVLVYLVLYHWVPGGG
jgi:putative membrane protein